MVGCKGCGKSVQAEVQAKQDRGEELTTQEQAVLQADNPSDAFPTFLGMDAYGRWSTYDGSFCTFCEKVGVALTIALTVGVTIILTEVTDLHSSALAFLGIALFATQMYLVGRIGRYPLLGAVFGPIVERLFAAGGVYLTEKAKRQYGGDPLTSEPPAGPVDEELLPTGSVTETTTDEVNVHLPPNPTEREQQLEEHLKKQKRVTKKERAEKNEFRSELQETKKEVNAILEEKESKESKLQSKEQEVNELAGRMEVLYGTYGRDRHLKNAIPLLGWDPDHNPIFKGFVVNVVWHRVQLEHYVGEYPNAFIVDTLQDVEDVSSIEGGIDDRIEGMQEFDRYAQYGRWLLDPRAVNDFPEFENPERPAYPAVESQVPIQARDEYPNVLFWNSAAGLREARTEPDGDSQRPKLPFYITAYDDIGNYVAPAFDPRGSENAAKERDQRRKTERLLGRRKSDLDELREQLKTLHHEYELTQDENANLRSRLNEARDRESEAMSTSYRLERELDAADTRTVALEDEVAEEKRRSRTLDDRRQRHRREKIEESDSWDEEVKTSESKRRRKETVLDAFQTIKATGYDGNGLAIDMDAVERGDGETSMEEVIGHFIEDPDAPDRVQRTVEQLVTRIGDTGGEAA